MARNAARDLARTYLTIEGMVRAILSRYGHHEPAAWALPEVAAGSLGDASHLDRQLAAGTDLRRAL